VWKGMNQSSTYAGRNSVHHGTSASTASRAGYHVASSVWRSAALQSGSKVCRSERLHAGEQMLFAARAKWGGKARNKLAPEAPTRNQSPTHSLFSSHHSFNLCHIDLTCYSTDCLR